MIPSGAVFFVLIVAVLLAVGLAWAVAALYQRRMLALMRGGTPPEHAEAVVESVPTQLASTETWGVGANSEANRRATITLMFGLGLVSLVVALTQSWLALIFVYDDGGFSLNRLLVLGLVYAWPMVLAWGLARRWTWARILGGIGIYVLLMLALVMARSTEDQTLASASGWLFSQVAIPMTIALFIGASGRIRAVAPYLLPICLPLAGSSVLALQIASQRVQDPAPWLSYLVETLGAYPTLAILAFGPWLALAWPMYSLVKGLAHAYRAKRFSDLIYLIAIYWFVILFANALPAMESAGWKGFIQMLAWLWLPVILCALRGPLKPPPGPPTLLVLRVFQRDAQIERLFDQVIERWRLTGNTILIAGTDALGQTLDPDDIFVFLNGTLAERFIATPAQVAERIDGFDWLPDPDGRYRINECYCFDSTWKTALHALIARSTVVLMDLRGFRPENRGCRFELGVLAGATHLRRVVVLHDRDTARAVAESEIHPAARERFLWLPADRMNSAMAGSVLAALFGKAG